MIITSSVVLYNTPRQQIETLLNCMIPSRISIIFLIDNSNDDRLRNLEKKSSKIYYIHNKNMGYGTSNNIGLQEALNVDSDYHLIVNPDIRFESDIIDILSEYMRVNEDVVYILPKVLNPEGETQHLCKLLPTPYNLILRRFLPKTRHTEIVNNRYTLVNWGYNTVINPPCLSGCFMFLRLSTIRKHNIFFDTHFFMYCEDFDIIRRLHRYGKTIYYPNAYIIHDHAKQSYHSLMMLSLHIKSAIKYFNKYGWFIDKERRKMNNAILKELDL